MSQRSLARPHARRSLRRQLVVTITGLHMLLMGSFVYDLLGRQQQFLLERARSRTTHQATVLAASAVPQLITKDLAGLQEVLESVSQDDTIQQAIVTDRGGLILGSNNPTHINTMAGEPQIARVLNGPAVASIALETSNKILAGAPVMIEGRVLGWAWVTTTLESDAKELLDIRRLGLFYTIVAVCIGGLCAWVVTRQATRQLRLLLAGTRRASEDHLDEPVPIVADNDVGFVAMAFNDAMAQLGRERAKLVQIQTELSNEVRERRRVEQDLRLANQAITDANQRLVQFSHAASHDLQEPLRTISSFANLLRRRYKDRIDQDANDFIDHIHGGSTRLQAQIRALLEYSRAGAPDGESPHAVDTRKACENACENLAAALELAGASVHMDELPPVWAHEIALVQLFQNLIGNALKYAAVEHLQIDVDAVLDGHYWRFQIHDNGVGVAPADQQKIFGLFKRAHGAERPGAGMGLAICSRIVERYGGRIGVTSEPGKGATFWFTLPAVEDAASSGSASSTGPPETAGASALPHSP